MTDTHMDLQTDGDTGTIIYAKKNKAKITENATTRRKKTHENTTTEK